MAAVLLAVGPVMSESLPPPASVGEPPGIVLSPGWDAPASSAIPNAMDQHHVPRRGLLSRLCDGWAAPAAPNAMDQHHAPCRRGLTSRFCDFWNQPADEKPVMPFGAAFEANMRAQVAAGEAAMMVLYQCDFVEGAPTMTIRGSQRLARIATRLSHNGFPVVIEATPGQPQLDEARRWSVLRELSVAPAPLLPDRVVVGPAFLSGLTGRQLEIVYANLLKQTLNGGTFLGSQTAGPTTGGTSGGSGMGSGTGGGQGSGGR